jgi:hypothetical protein
MKNLGTIKVLFFAVAKANKKNPIGIYGNTKKMTKVFTNYRINKNIDRTGVNALLKGIRTKTPVASDIIFTAVSAKGERIQESWVISKNDKGYTYNCLDKRSREFKTTVLNSLVYLDAVVIILICHMNQHLDKKSIKEMWGLKVTKSGKKTVYEEISSKEIYKYSTTNMKGKRVPHQTEVVYCGPDGKICGWDLE